MLCRYQICFYLDNQNLDLEHKLIIKANSSEEARHIAIAKCEPTNERANSNMRCDSLKSLMIINKLSKFL